MLSCGGLHLLVVVQASLRLNRDLEEKKAADSKAGGLDK
jgi:hypothetical protein